MSPDPTVQALVDAWDAFARAHGFNPAHDGMPSGSAWRGLEVMEEVLRAHVLITGDAQQGDRARQALSQTPPPASA